jgi:H+/Cl- antiporter ClcA
MVAIALQSVSVRSFDSPQPNVTGQGVVAGYGPRFWALVVATGVAAGLAGAATLELLKGLERLFATPGPLPLLAAGLVAGIGMVLVRRRWGAAGGETSEALWLGDARLRLAPSVARATLSAVIVGMGASLGREGAPQLIGAAAASTAADRARIPAWQRRLLVACGAGAGMAAVYNVPLGGALFAIEVLLGTITLPLVLPALATTVIATMVGWLVLPDRPVYHVPSYPLHASQVVWAALIGPLAGLAAVIWGRTIRGANARRPQRWGRIAAPAVIFTALGALMLAYPELAGNGLTIVQRSLAGRLTLGLLAVLLVLKPLATAACLGSGAPGGLFTPTLALGALLGGACGHVWTLVWPGAAAGSYALLGGAAVLAAAMQGPLAAIVLVIELTRHAGPLMVPMVLAVAEATVVARMLGAPSIYSARLGVPRAG